MAEKQLDLFKLSAGSSGTASPRFADNHEGRYPVRPRRWRAAAASARPLFRTARRLGTWSPRLTGRNTCPSTTRAVPVQASIATLTQTGIGTVRTRLCFPNTWTMPQRLSRCCMCSIVSAATSERRSPQPRRTAMMPRFDPDHSAGSAEHRSLPLMKSTTLMAVNNALREAG